MMRSGLSTGLALSLIGVLLVSPGARAAAADAAVADAAMQRDRNAVRSLLAQGADVNAAQGDGMTALHWAAMKGDADLAKTLIEAGANVKAATRVGSQTPLHLAARIGEATIMAALVKAGAEVNAATETGTTPLMLAAGAGNPDAVRMLLAHGANPNAAEAAKGHTALMFAAAANRADAVKVLLRSGADPAVMTKVFDLSTVLIPPDRTAQANASTAASRAERNNPNPRATIAGLDRRYEQNELVASQGGLTALLFASRQGHSESVRALLEGGAGINQLSAGVHISPLVIAIVNGQFDLAMYMLDQGADPHLVAENGVGPLYAVLNCQWSDEVEYPQPQAYIQQKTSYLALMKRLIDKGADPDARLKKKVWYSGYARDLSGVDETGATPFWRAAYANDLEAMRLLVAHGADPNIPTASIGGRPPVGGPNLTAMHIVADFNIGARTHPSGWQRVFDYLTGELGADVNARDAAGNTPLHFAAASGDNVMVMYLVSKGADVKAVNQRGQTTVDMANGPVQRVQPYPETIKLLEALGAKNNHRCVSC